MSKRIFTAVISILIALACLSGCLPEAHTHTATIWERDVKEHWKLCECGEELERAAHTLDDMDMCAVCNSEVWEYDNSAEVYTYNENGDLVHSTEYDANGTPIHDWKCDVTYDEDGNKLYEKYYDNGRLTDEYEYETNENGESYQISYVTYQENGEKNTGKYDENGNVIEYAYYGEDGTLITQTLSEYATDRNGDFYESKMTEKNYTDNTTYVCEYNEYGDIVTRVKYVGEEVEYSEQYEREYGEDGKPIWEKTYENGILVHEIVSYAENSDDNGWWRYPETVIEYEADGSRVVYKYGGNGEVETEIYYAPDGSVEKEIKYEYTYNDDGTFSMLDVYENGVLVSESIYSVDADGFEYVSQENRYEPDGMVVITEYNELGEVVDVTKMTPIN